MLVDGQNILNAYGKIMVGDKCLARNPKDTGLVLTACAPYDGPDQDAQFFFIPFHVPLAPGGEHVQGGGLVLG